VSTNRPDSWQQLPLPGHENKEMPDSESRDGNMTETNGNFEVGGRNPSMQDVFDKWLQAFGGAWQAGNADDIVGLFDQDGSWFETPFGPPVKGAAAIRDHWEQALQGQGDIVFMYRMLATNSDMGVARWAAQFDLLESGVRVECDGIIECRLTAGGKARVARIWWHNREAPKRKNT